MLDYAANGARYWGERALRQMFERSCAESGQDTDAVLDAVIGPDRAADDFWVQAERNLRGGVLRLVFVADVIPEELRAIIEFLNTGMHSAEVFGIEVRRYGGPDMGECFVPRLIGATAAATGEKRLQPSLQSSLDDKLREAPGDVRITADRLRFLAEELGLAVREVRASLRVCDQSGPVVLLYPTYRALEFPLYSLLDAGRATDVTHVRDILQEVAGTDKKVALKAPNVGCSESLARWDLVTALVRDLARIRAELRGG